MAQKGYTTENGHEPSGPKTELDFYSRVVEPSVDDEELEGSNYGLGHYSSREFYQQVETFVEGRYASAAFARRIFERAVYETKRALAREMYDELGEAARSEWDRREYINDHMDEAWASLEVEDEGLGQDEQEYLTTQRRLQALSEHAGISRDWKPPQHRMMDFKHEASRSRGARLMDNAFGRVTRYETDGDNSQELARRLRGRS